MKDLELYLIQNNGKGNLTWNEVGKLFGKSGNAVRHVWRRIKNKNLNNSSQDLNLNNIPELQNVSNFFQPVIPVKEDGMYLVLGCVHAPFTNKAFWKAMLKLAQEHKNNIKGIILAGDFLDLHSLSNYDKGQIPIKGVTLSMEYEGGNAYLNSLLNTLNGDIYKGWIRGNHEHRHSKYMKDVNNSKLGDALPTPEKALKLVDRGFEIFTDWVNDEIQLGDLTIIHGEICAVHVAKKMIDTFKRNFLMFHTHRVQMYREGEHVAYNAGTMADFDSPVFNYATKAMKKTWSNAFAVATLSKGKTSVETPVWNGKSFTFGGKIYK